MNIFHKYIQNKDILLMLKRFSFLLLLLLFTLFFFFKIPSSDILATNVLTNPSFTGGSTGWTLSSTTYSSTTYQDSAGSVQVYATRKTTDNGYATQTGTFTNTTGNIVTLSGYWMTTQVGNRSYNEFYIEIENQANIGTWTQIWASGRISTSTSWTHINNVDVSSYFGNGTYKLRLYMKGYGGTAAGNEAYGWII